MHNKQRLLDRCVWQPLVLLSCERSLKTFLKMLLLNTLLLKMLLY